MSSGHEITGLGAVGHEEPEERRRAPAFPESGDTFLAFIFHPLVGLGSLAVLVIGAFFMPIHSHSISMCAFHQMTGIPCPGCGLTRSVTCILHGRLLAAWQYNPFGYAFTFTFTLVAVLGLMPRAFKLRLRERLQGKARWIFAVVVAFMFLMMIHGVVRGILVGSDSPAYRWWRTDELAPAMDGKPVDMSVFHLLHQHDETRGAGKEE